LEGLHEYAYAPGDTQLYISIMVSETQSKAYVKAQGLPTMATWNQEDQGYIAKRCDHYTTEPYSNTNIVEDSIFIRKLILMTFLFINLSILTAILKCGYGKLHHRIHSSFSPIFWAAAIAMGTMNVGYLILLIWAHSYKHLPRILLENLFCPIGTVRHHFFTDMNCLHLLLK